MKRKREGNFSMSSCQKTEDNNEHHTIIGMRGRRRCTTWALFLIGAIIFWLDEVIISSIRVEGAVVGSWSKVNNNNNKNDQEYVYEFVLNRRRGSSSTYSYFQCSENDGTSEYYKMTKKTARTSLWHPLLLLPLTIPLHSSHRLQQ